MDRLRRTPVEPDAGIVDRARGCLLGQLGGDSLGSLVEFRSMDAIRRQYPDGLRDLADGGYWDTLAGQPTDDSELALTLARVLLAEGRFDPRKVVEAYVNWYQSDPFDMGGTTRTALRAAVGAVEKGGDPVAAAEAAASITSQANGALMRVSPLGIFGHALEPAALADLARREAGLTHPNPVCRDASAAYTVTLAHVIRHGTPPGEVYERTMEWAAAQGLHPDILATLENAADQAPPDFQVNMGWVRTALQNAFFQLTHAAGVEEGVVDTVMRGGDTDTNGAIAGALLGACHGLEGVPERWRCAILQCRPQAGRPGVRRPRPQVFWPGDALELAGRLAEIGSQSAASGPSAQPGGH
ncbi:MAG: ADP-ribosylglycohydrolase family protein [Thermoleophilia bacterium]|nr:ADP-ribosylglycohydrolase family protein [Thermoleophilia bacterium]